MGERIAPELFCTKPSHSTCSFDFATAIPPTVSEWPPRNFVVECMTMSAPRASGCWRYGEQNVLSTTTIAPTRWASSERSGMSASRMVGFVGDSRWSIRVSGRMALSTAAGSAVSTKSKVTP